MSGGRQRVTFRAPCIVIKYSRAQAVWLSSLNALRPRAFSQSSSYQKPRALAQGALGVRDASVGSRVFCSLVRWQCKCWPDVSMNLAWPWAPSLTGCMSLKQVIYLYQSLGFLDSKRTAHTGHLTGCLRVENEVTSAKHLAGCGEW